MSFKVASSLCTLFKSLHIAIMHGVFNITITNIFFIQTAQCYFPKSRLKDPIVQDIS
mgnify:CR=1 FL=1